MSRDVSVLDDLELADEQVSVAESHREERAGDWAAERRGETVRPDAVVWPESTADVAAVLAAATDHGVAVTPYAAGTGLEGNAVPVEGGISLDLSRMDAIVDYRPAALQVDVQPGVIGSAVDEHVAADGLFFPPLPSSGDLSTIGGMLATDASGMGTVKYGEVREWVPRVEAVLADGTVIEAGSRATKSSSGYNLKDLLVGSEGTLAVLTEATLELSGRPEQIRGGRAVFDSLGDAADAIADAIRSGVDVAKIELIDEVSAELANAYLASTDATGTRLPDAPMVFLEFHANHGVDREVAFCRSIFEAHGVERFAVAADGEGMADLWRLRREMAYAESAYDPDLEPIHAGDVTVPIDAFPEIVRYTREVADAEGLIGYCFGHAGDGNLHYSMLVDLDDPEHVERGERAYAAVVERAIELGGTATGEHGVGTGKRRFMTAEHGREAVETMRAIKRSLDPAGTLNPGKVFPDDEDE